MNKKELNVGDRMYIKSYRRIVAIVTITSVTKTLARSKNYVFDRSSYYIKGQGEFSTKSAFIETPELKKELALQKKKNGTCEAETVSLLSK
jgi:hypothetical protein